MPKSAGRGGSSAPLAGRTGFEKPSTGRGFSDRRGREERILLPPCLEALFSGDELLASGSRFIDE
ncbi:MAG: hypothetical protein QMD46_06610 [Methanomicrobiales archaeon]|nr:hypothetical protein [Methanomicrobiales archaeon]